MTLTTFISEILKNIVKLFSIKFDCREFRGKAPFVGYFEVKSPIVLLIDPQAVKSVLVKNFKNFHDSIFSKMVN